MASLKEKLGKLRLAAAREKEKGDVESKSGEERPKFLELFSGFGPLTKAVARQGCEHLEAEDFQGEGGEAFDLLSHSVFKRLVKLVRKRNGR